MNNGCREDNSYCYFHPRELVIGVCPLCLNERLLILASAQGRRSSAFRSAQKSTPDDKKSPVNFHKIFDFGSILHRLEFRPWKSDFHDDHDASTSQEDSFISIKFEENGKASWENNKKNKMSWQSVGNGEEQQPCKEAKTVIEHGKPRGSSLRWRKRIGHAFQLIRWKSNKVEGVKKRKGWIRAMTKKRTME